MSSKTLSIAGIGVSVLALVSCGAVPTETPPRPTAQETSMLIPEKKTDDILATASRTAGCAQEKTFAQRSSCLAVKFQKDLDELNKLTDAQKKALNCDRPEKEVYGEIYSYERACEQIRTAALKGPAKPFTRPTDAAAKDEKIAALEARLAALEAALRKTASGSSR